MKVTTTKTDMRSLCLQENPRMYSEREPSYQHTGKKFTKPQQTNIVRTVDA